MGTRITPAEALVYVMVIMSAADRAMADVELRRIRDIVRMMPAFDGFDEERLVAVSGDCAGLLGDEDGLAQVLDRVTEALPPALRPTAYAMAVEVAAADLDLRPEELRLLAILGERLDLDPLSVAAIQHAARVRHRRA